MSHSRHGAMTARSGRERAIDELEAELVVPLAGAAVSHRVGADPPRRLHLMEGEHGPSERRAQEVSALVDRSRAERRPDVVAHELGAEILDDGLAGAAGEGLRLEPVELVLLAHVAREGHHLAPVMLEQPRHDDRRVESSRVGQHDLARAFGHVRPPVPASAATGRRYVVRLVRAPAFGVAERFRPRPCGESPMRFVHFVRARIERRKQTHRIGAGARDEKAVLPRSLDEVGGRIPARLGHHQRLHEAAPARRLEERRIGGEGVESGAKSLAQGLNPSQKRRLGDRIEDAEADGAHGRPAREGGAMVTRLEDARPPALR